MKHGWKILAGEVIGDEACPLMKRWGLNTPIGSVRLHHFLRGDNERHLHDHPWWFVTFVIRGGYEDVTFCDRCGGTGGDEQRDGPCSTCRGERYVTERLRPGSIRFRPALHRHAVRTEDAWSIVITGPLARTWGFYLKAREWLSEKDYFANFGHSACEDLVLGGPQRPRTVGEILAGLGPQTCACVTVEEGWRPCPESLCERPDHLHDVLHPGLG